MKISCGICIVNKNHKILVNKIWESQDYYEIAKGGLEKFDTCEYDCAVRELLEEFGLNILDYTSSIQTEVELDYIYYNLSRVRKKLKPFIICLSTDGSELVMINGENPNLHWVHIDKLLNEYKCHYTQANLFKVVKMLLT
jgi:8-oxo-dGTP pyrophosphatase MutT (NUDIX family)